jgi:hypothetical protein
MHPAPRSFGALALAALLATAATAAAQTAAPDRESERLAAAAALPTLRQVATGDKALRLGFRSPDEVAQATLGEPLPIRTVRLDALRGYEASKPPESILIAEPRVLFPVLAGSEVRIGIEVRQTQGTWKAAVIGGARVAVLLHAARATHRAAAPTGTVYSAVEIPALNLYLLAADGPAAHDLILLADDARFPGLKAGQPVPAAEALAALVPAARALDPNGST